MSPFCTRSTGVSICLLVCLGGFAAPVFPSDDRVSGAISNTVEAPITAAFSATIRVAEQTRLVVEIERSGRRQLISEPPGQTGSRRLRPVALVASANTVELAWLEGDRPRGLRVMAARWAGESWTQPTVVSPEGPGSQTALTGALLADGTMLLVWSAFDGTDDEIQFSRGTAAGWTSPARLAADNAVPDITPTVTAHASGALVAWSRYTNGEYRVHLARAGARAFSPPQLFGPAGSIDPLFRVIDGRTFLLYRHVAASGWAVHELGADAQTTARGIATKTPSETPEEVFTGSGGVVLRFSDGSVVSVDLRADR